MFLHRSAAAFVVPRVHYTSCFGHADRLTVPHLMCWSFTAFQSCRSSEAANGPREDVWLHSSGRQSRGSIEAMFGF